MDVDQSTDSPAAPPSLPPYPEMILAAIEGLNEESGSNKSSIWKYIEDTYGELPSAHSTLLSDNLNTMKQSGQLTMVKNNYTKADPNAPPRRGRGRPPKPKGPMAAAAALVEASKPRGRPPKPIDPLAPPRPRGRPPKKAKTVAVTAAVGVPRGRGRPPKVKPPVAAEVGC